MWYTLSGYAGAIEQLVHCWCPSWYIPSACALWCAGCEGGLTEEEARERETTEAASFDFF